MKWTNRTNGMALLTAAGLATPVLAQPATTPGGGETVNVTPDPASWRTSTDSNAITIPSGADGVIINNALGGVIRSDTLTAIETSAFTTVNNSGFIFGGFNGVNFVNGFGSGILNNFLGGVISSDSRGVNIGGTVDLFNAGTILGTGDQRNGTVYSDSVANNFTINNSGTIDAGAGNQGSGIGLEIAQTTATIVNSGLVQGRTNSPGVSPGSGLSGDGLRLANFTPLAPGEVRFFDGTITNEAGGVIASESGSGTIAGLRVADSIGFQGQLTNAGTIVGPQNGLYIGNGDHTGGVVNNSGLISSDSRAFNLDGNGLTVNNDGQIVGTGTQRNGTFYADGTADNYTVSNNAFGIIDAGAGNEGSGFGAEVGGAADGANTFSLTNAGLIQGRGNAGAALNTAGDGVRIGNVGNIGVAEVTLNNTGTIASEGANGTVAGIRFVNGVSFSGELNNSGTITGVQNGVYFGNPVNGQGADHSNGVVNNSGLISSDSRAVNIDGDGLTLTNSGDILATGRQRNGTVYADGTADNFTVNNLSGGVIDARGGAGSGVSIQVGSFSGDVQTATIENSGLIAGSGSEDVDAGVRLFTNDPGATFRGNIVNSSGGTILSLDAPAVLVQDGVVFDGALVNGGRIEGGASLATGDVQLLSTSVISLEIGGLSDGAFETFDAATGSIDFAGTLEITFRDSFLPEVGDVFDLFDFAQASGEFSSINAGRVVFDTSDLLIGGTITVTAIPAPATTSALAGIGLLAARRRRRS
ncbi:MAG: calcium-binding protein [Planctomycetota bacterium]